MDHIAVIISVKNNRILRFWTYHAALVEIPKKKLVLDVSFVS